MVGVTKRRVQAGRRDDFEVINPGMSALIGLGGWELMTRHIKQGGAGSKATRMEGSTEEVQRKLHHHFNETAFLQGQWRVRGYMYVGVGVGCWMLASMAVCGRSARSSHPH